jgi:hypothetical protein
MIRKYDLKDLLAALAFSLSMCGAIGVSSIAAADDAAPPAASPGDDGQHRHHDPAWAACKKQADDQKLQAGDARRDFMKACLKSAHDSAHPAS